MADEPLPGNELRRQWTWRDAVSDPVELWKAAMERAQLSPEQLRAAGSQVPPVGTTLGNVGGGGTTAATGIPFFMRDLWEQIEDTAPTLARWVHKTPWPIDITTKELPQDTLGLTWNRQNIRDMLKDLATRPKGGKNMASEMIAAYGTSPTDIPSKVYLNKLFPPDVNPLKTLFHELTHNYLEDRPLDAAYKRLSRGAIKRLHPVEANQMLEDYADYSKPMQQEEAIVRAFANYFMRDTPPPGFRVRSVFGNRIP